MLEDRRRRVEKQETIAQKISVQHMLYRAIEVGVQGLNLPVNLSEQARKQMKADMDAVVEQFQKEIEQGRGK
jgi:hypothetical protein